MTFAFYDDDTEEAITLWMQIERDRDSEISTQRRGGSRTGRSPNHERRRHLYASLLDDDFWGAEPVYNGATFQNLFRMPRALFNEVADQVHNVSRYIMGIADTVPTSSLLYCKRSSKDLPKYRALLLVLLGSN